MSLARSWPGAEWSGSSSRSAPEYLVLLQQHTAFGAAARKNRTCLSKSSSLSISSISAPSGAWWRVQGHPPPSLHQLTSVASTKVEGWRLRLVFEQLICVLLPPFCGKSPFSWPHRSLQFGYLDKKGSQKPTKSILFEPPCVREVSRRRKTVVATGLALAAITRKRLYPRFS